jgi:hypothetical protein
MAWLRLAGMLIAASVPTTGWCQNAAAFAAAVEEFARRGADESAWTGHVSPWAPYVAVQLSTFLSPEDRKQSENRQRAGECETVLTLEQRGLFNRYPELIPSFASATVRSVFERYVVPLTSHAHRRCTAFALMIPIVEATKRKWFLEDTFTVDLPRLSIWDEPPKLASDEALAYRTAARSLYALAFCARFMPAIADVIEIEADLHANQLDYAMLRLLQTMAAGAGVETVTLEQHLRSVRASTPTQEVLRIDDLLGAAWTAVSPAWPSQRLARLCAA